VSRIIGESIMPRVLLLLLALFVLAPPALAQDRIVTEANGSRTLIVEVWVPATPEQVWPAVSTAEGWKSWAVPNAWMAEGVMETSYTPGAKQGDPANIQHRLTTLIPGTLLAFQTIRTPPGFPHAAAFMGVNQHIELLPDGTGTRVRLTGSNYPAGAEGTELLGFFQQGNRMTLDKLAARFGLAPLDFLVGHCWKGMLPTGEPNIHCFDRVDGNVRDRHEVLRDGKKVYGGETIYAWDGDARTVRFVYTGMGGSGGKGMMRPDGADLDFGSNDYSSGSGTITVATRWVRVAPDAYEARDTSSDARFSHTVKYTRVD
jgi:uncharacterized protein YndB with AHSA1/START domain